MAKKCGGKVLNLISYQGNTNLSHRKYHYIPTRIATLFFFLNESEFHHGSLDGPGTYYVDQPGLEPIKMNLSLPALRC